MMTATLVRIMVRTPADCIASRGGDAIDRAGYFLPAGTWKVFARSAWHGAVCGLTRIHTRCIEWAIASQVSAQMCAIVRRAQALVRGR